MADRRPVALRPRLTAGLPTVGGLNQLLLRLAMSRRSATEFRPITVSQTANLSPIPDDL